jgi:probable rRNA maturation factor
LPIKRIVKKWLRALVASKGFSLENINLIFCSDNYLLKVNKEHLDHDFFTDIITFDYCHENRINGDLFISYDRVVENAYVNKAPIQEELLRVISHGVLHLLGFTDKELSAKEEMTRQEELAITQFYQYVPRETPVQKIIS